MLVSRIVQRIASEGPLPFEEFQRMALYEPDLGFFATGPIRSARDGDFLTSPEVSRWFGTTLSRFVGLELSRLAPDGVLVEFGGGSGSLIGPLLEAMDDPIEAYIIEASPQAAEAAGSLPGVVAVSTLSEIPTRSAVVLANEVADNIPAALAVRTGGGWEERRVDAVDGSLRLVRAEARADVSEWADRYGGNVPEGAMVEVQIEAGEWLREILRTLDRGAVLVVDYGGKTEELEPRRTRGTLRTYRNHHLGPDPLLEPGETDITVDVQFTALLDVATECGWDPELHRQDDFLRALGLGDTIRELRDRELIAARAGDAMERLRLRSERGDAETLLHPRGLGDFRVLVARR